MDDADVQTEGRVKTTSAAKAKRRTNKVRTELMLQNGDILTYPVCRPGSSTKSSSLPRMSIAVGSRIPITSRSFTSLM